MYISIRNGIDIKTWNNLLQFATNEITLYLDEERHVRQRENTIFASSPIVSTWTYKESWTSLEAVLDYFKSDQCRKRLESQGYKLYKIEEIII